MCLLIGVLVGAIALSLDEGITSHLVVAGMVAARKDTAFRALDTNPISYTNDDVRLYFNVRRGVCSLPPPCVLTGRGQRRPPMGGHVREIISQRRFVGGRPYCAVIAMSLSFSILQIVIC